MSGCDGRRSVQDRCDDGVAPDPQSNLEHGRYANGLGKPYRGYFYPVRENDCCTGLGIPVFGGPCAGRNPVEHCPSNGDASAFDELESPGLELVKADMLVGESNTQDY